MENGVSDSICGDINLFFDTILFEVRIPLASSSSQVCYTVSGQSEVCIEGERFTQSPSFSGGQGYWEVYRIFWEAVVSWRRQDNQQLLWTYRSYGYIDGYAYQLTGRTRINAPGWNRVQHGIGDAEGYNQGQFQAGDGGYPNLTVNSPIYRVDDVFNTSASVAYIPCDCQMTSLAITGIARLDGTSTANDVAQYGTRPKTLSVFDANDMLISTIINVQNVRKVAVNSCRIDQSKIDFVWEYRRMLPGSRIAITNVIEDGRYVTRIIEYYSGEYSFTSPISPPLNYSQVIGEYASPTGCQVYPLISWDCNGKCYQKKCPPDTCYKLREGDSVCCIGADGTVLSVVPSDCESADCSC